MHNTPQVIIKKINFLSATSIKKITDKKSKKNTTKDNKKAPKNKAILKLKLDNDVEIPAKTAYPKATKYFKINDIDIDKIRVSDKKLYNKEHNSYKYYVFL